MGQKHVQIELGQTYADAETSLLESLKTQPDRSSLQLIRECLEQVVQSGEKTNRKECLAHLVLCDLTWQWKDRSQGQTIVGPMSESIPHIEDYCEAFPELQDDREELLTLLVHEYQLRTQYGDVPSHHEYLTRYADLAAELKERLQTVDAQLAAETESQNLSLDQTVQDPKAKPINHQDPAEDATIIPVEGLGDESMEPILREFGDHELLEEIARGGMGVVYRARQVKLNRIVAVKMILSGQLASEQDIARFYTEAEAAAKLDHPGIVPIYEVGELEGQHFFSMGYVKGSSLAEKVKAGPMEPQKAAEYVRQVAEAIEYAHQHGVIHRDIKPSNILLTVKDLPRVTDFGLAKSVEGDSEMTASGQILGTPGYMPPEQASGAVHQVNHLADVYSLGALLYALLTGRPPFQSSNFMETLKQVVEQPPVSPRLLNPAVDLDLETICLKCLEKNSENRLQSAQELSEELQRYLNGEPIRSRRVGMTTRLWRWCKRHPWPVALASLTVVLSVAVYLAIQMAGKLSVSGQLSEWDRQFETLLEEPELSEEYLSEMETLLQQIRELNETQAEESRIKLNAVLAEEVQQEISQPRLTEEKIQHLDQILALMQTRAPEETEKLQRTLQQRLSDWRPIFELKSPFSNLETVFPQEMFAIDGDQEFLHPQERSRFTPLDLDSPEISTDVPCRNDATFEVVFAPSWETAPAVGVSLYSVGEQGYDFLIQIPKDQPEDILESGIIRNFKRARRSKLPVHLVIRRNGTDLIRKPVSLSQIPSGPLRIRASHSRGELQLRINSDLKVSFFDPFSSELQAGVFGLKMTGAMSLLELSARSRRNPIFQTGLEQGDTWYREGNVRQAHDAFEREALASSSVSIRQEATYKQALCLLQMDRGSDAEVLLSRLLGEEGDRWPPLASVQLWVHYIRTDRMSEANSLFDVLSAHHQFSQLLPLLDEQTRQEILGAYFQNQNNITLFLEKNRVHRDAWERASAVDRFLSFNGRGTTSRQLEIVRSYRLAEDWQKALETVERLIQDPERKWDPMMVWHYSRLLRRTGQSQKALEVINESIQEVTASDRWAYVPPELLVTRIRIYIDLGRLEEAFDELQRHLDLSDPHAKQHDLPGRGRSYVWLIKGILLHQQGKKDQAQECWSQGYREGAHCFERESLNSTEPGPLNAFIMGTLSGEISREVVEKFVQSSLGRSNSSLGVLPRLISMDGLHKACLAMWNSPKGMETVKGTALDTLPLRDRVRMPVILLGLTYASQNSLGAFPSHLDQQILWDLSEEMFEEFVNQQVLGNQGMIQLGLAWKGQKNLLGWGGISGRLEGEQRGRLSYVLGHRFVRLNRKSDARSFFTTAIKDTPEKSLVNQQAKLCLKLLDAGKGELSIASNTQQSVQIEVMRGGKVIGSLNLPEQSRFELSPGTVSLKIVKGESVSLSTQDPVPIQMGAVSQVELINETTD